MITSHVLGFPRIGSHRELKQVVEEYWAGAIDEQKLHLEGTRIYKKHWAIQAKAGLSYVTVGDFSWYDQILDMSVMLGVIPERFDAGLGMVSIDTYFRMARGRAPKGKDVRACEMTKWFDTNYHYIVPEFTKNQEFNLRSTMLFKMITEAKQAGHKVKPVIIGPMSYLWLGKTYGNHFDKLELLPQLLEIYQEIFNKFNEYDLDWVQIDEPILILDLPEHWQQAFQRAYQQLSTNKIKLLLTTYFGGLEENTRLSCNLPTAGLHIDISRAPGQLDQVLELLPHNKILSVGIIDGRNIWRNDIRDSLNILKPVYGLLKERLWIASSCSLLHTPVDLNQEKLLDPELKKWLAFSVQKIEEIAILAKGLDQDESSIVDALTLSDEAIASKKVSANIHKPAVTQRLKEITPSMTQRTNSRNVRKKIQKNNLNLPLFPTTTIGSFPQTSEIRLLRQQVKKGLLNADDYNAQLREHIKACIQKQEDIGLDVLVHGEFERNDMVEYFSDFLEGFAITQNGWVQSYGTRCVKPPIIFGDIQRRQPMTIEWINYAQSLTPKKLKGMLTGPTTMISWSFVRNDQPRLLTAKQMAYALRDEIHELEEHGIQVIQVDEPAFRESLPLRHRDWQSYLNEAIVCFKLATAGVKDSTQIHTHMCYSEFNDIIESISELDADVVSIEASRSDMELLQAFKDFDYPGDIGPGIYDVHSPQVPGVAEIINLIEQATKYIAYDQLWINPDCGLKTRGWHETEKSLVNLVEAAKKLRDKFQSLLN